MKEEKLSEEDQELLDILEKIGGDDPDIDAVLYAHALASGVVSKKAALKQLGLDYEKEMSNMSNQKVNYGGSGKT